MRFPPYIFFNSNPSTTTVVSGGRAISISNDDFVKFRKHSIACAIPLKNPKEILKPTRSLKLFGEWASQLGWSEPTSDFDHAVPVNEMIKSCSEALATWRSGITSNHLSSALQSRAGATMYLIEICSYVFNTPRILHIALEHASDSISESILQRLYESEKGHYLGLCKDLVIEPTELAMHDPAPGTVMMLTFLESIARQNTLKFLVAVATLEADLIQALLAHKFLTKLERKTHLSLVNFKAHVEIDTNEGHQTLWMDYLIRMRSQFISKSIADETINVVHQTRHIQMLWLDSISYRCREAKELDASLKIKGAHSFLRRPFGVNSFAK